ncbi:hypothetical protein [Saccharothrix sp. ST-888]|uniref:hypothetical protein n=1 Tax=Saccharothrix sp. ST-888 TaxID=1427391 RepID=UPI0005ED0F31|nr:hypothetical protein [Saccharothrix sp. ST-888]
MSAAQPGPPASPAIRRVAVATTLTLLPSGLWRTAVALGVPSGFGPGDLLHEGDVPLGLSVYMIALSLFAEGLGLLTLGLAQPWGEVVPRWVPLLGGRRVPILAAVIPAALGAATVTVLAVAGAFHWNSPTTMGSPTAPTGTAARVMTACYAPLLLWGPLLAIVTVAYYRRRRRETHRGLRTARSDSH